MEKNNKLTSYEKLDFSTHVIMFLTIMGMVLWFHAEARQDWRKTDAKIEEHRRETSQILSAIHAEMKDFHGRLCAIEERNRGK